MSRKRRKKEKRRKKLRDRVRARKLKNLLQADPELTKSQAQCQIKSSYPNEVLAKWYARIRGYRYYACTECDKWHLTSQLRSELET